MRSLSLAALLSLAFCPAWAQAVKTTTTVTRTQQTTTTGPARPKTMLPPGSPQPPPAPPAPGVKAHSLTVFAENGEKFFLILDGEKQNERPQARVHVKELAKPYYRVKVIFDDERLGDFNANVQLEGVDPGYNDVTYVVRRKTKKNRSYYTLVWNKAVKIGEADGGTRNDDLDDSDPLDPTPHQNLNPTPVNPADPAPVAPATPCGPALSDEAFQTALKSVEAASFEKTRLQTAQVIATGNCLTAAQIRDILKKFSFENTRREFAHWAYPRCLDRANYLQVADGFEFTTSRQALTQFLLNQGR